MVNQTLNKLSTHDFEVYKYAVCSGGSVTLSYRLFLCLFSRVLGIVFKMPAALDNSYRRRFLSVRLLYYLVERMQATPFTHSQRLQSMIERLCANLEGVVSLLVS